MKKIKLVCIKYNVSCDVYERELNAQTMEFIRICLSNKDYDRIDIENI